MVGYEDIGNLMHKIEDMLDCARNGSILFDQSIVSLCFEGFDTVKKMLQFKKEPGSQEILDSLVSAASRISKMIEVFIRLNKKEEKKAVIVQPEIGIVSSQLNKKRKGKNKYYITFFFEEDAPMVSPVVLMILNCVGDIGTLVFSSVGDNYFSDCSGENEIKTFDIIISTDINEAELYTNFALFYIEKINIVDLSRNKVEESDHSFITTDDTLYVIILAALMKLYKIAFNLPNEFKISKDDIDIMKSLHSKAIHAFEKMKNKNVINVLLIDFNGLYSHIIKIDDDQVNFDKKLQKQVQTQVVKLIESAYNYTKGRHIFSIFISERDNFISRLRNFTSMLNKSRTLILLIDLSKLTTLHENEVKALIEIKKQIEAQNIQMNFIAEGSEVRRIINIFDSIKQVEEFHVFESQLAAILGIFDCDASFNRVNKSIKDVQYE